MRNNWYNAALEEGNYYDDYEGTDADEDGIGDGAKGAGEMVNHCYSFAGNYTVNLTVTDDRGAKNSTSKMIRVIEKEIFDTGEPENPYPYIFDAQWHYHAL